MKACIKPIPLTEIENRFKANLQAWCVVAALEEFDECDVETYGPNILMDDNSFRCVLICTQAKKIKTVEDIMKESSWI